ncbi:MAG: hypothetical protein WA902_03665 [Thermosynechococcaceae cyanobacterium]
MQDGNQLIILLGGGTKKTQSADIKRANKLCQEYKRRKKVSLDAAKDKSNN